MSVAIIFLGLSMSTSAFRLAIIHDRAPDNPPLPDICFDVVPYQTWALDASELINTALINISSIIVFFHKHRLL